MQSPTFLPNEAERLVALYRLNLLDTPAEERFDRITRMARRLFDVPIAVVTLLDQDRQWFKSKQGIDSCQTPREISFCGHTILSKHVMVIEDAACDVRFDDNPLVIGEPHIRFYAGYPLTTMDDHRIGALCIIDVVPRRFNREDQAMLQDLGQLVEQEFTALKLAMTDDLTQISNRRGFMMLARIALEWCTRQQQQAWLVYFDLNRFKQINDQFGHKEGDRCLQIFAQTLQQTYGEHDIFARLGGDEFALLMVGADVVQLQQRLATFRQALGAQIVHYALAYHIEYAYGYVKYDPQHPQAIDQLLIEADGRMYRYKRLSKH